MEKKRLTLNKNTLVILLDLYAISIFVWDYTIIYQSVLVLMALCTFVLYNKRVVRPIRYIISSALFILYFIIHTLAGRAVNSSLAQDYIVTLIVNLFAIISVVRIADSEEKIESVFRAVIGAALIVWIYVVIVDRANILSGGLGATVKKPIVGGEYSHNNLPMLAGVAVLFITYFRLKKKPIRYTILLYVFFTSCVILSGARKALICVIFGLILFPLFFSAKSQRTSEKLIRILLLAFSMILIAYIILNNAIMYRFIGYRFQGAISGLLGGEYSDSSAETRSVMAATAISSIKQNFWLGIGLNNFRTLPGSFRTWSHNNYLEIMVSGGIVPLILYYYPIVNISYKLGKNKREPMGGMFLTFMVYLLIHDLLSVSYNARNIGLMLGLAAAYTLMCDSTKRNESNLMQIDSKNDT